MIRLDGSGLDPEQFRRIVLAGEEVVLDPAALAAVDAARERLLALLESGVTAYGVNTGLGYLASTRLDDERQRTFQRALLLRGAGTGPPPSASQPRGASSALSRTLKRGRYCLMSRSSRRSARASG